jgi:phosphohistidine phosphatase
MPMHLILWRHADAEDAPPGKSDAERNLTAKGEKQARRVAAWLEKRLPDDARVVASPAQRALQTARALTKDYETSREVGTGADARAVLKAAGWPQGDRAVVVVGHQPTLGQAAALALTGKASEWSVKKGAVWWIESRGGDEVIIRAVISPDMV